ncbi:CidA/LrgA family protein [Gallaecimonas xiamenensis]|uniref:LrgA family protein n=1 Tax=Gallaecimonas xiamenensis 3-C-1 TaxID=745411 RepID=K2K099_9GAMM|nr:CidA/LrgA family protein [Gallaecimonas xiamenensis]EKE70960.1 hypothetical protein B3C1_13229 [Gallaecimonas xiamenensis 3-C-1]
MHFIRAALVLLACLYVGKGLVALTHIPIPGSILGMLLLFVLLSSGRLPPAWVSPVTIPLIRHMTLLFIPAGVGLMDHLGLLGSHVLVLVGATLLSTWALILLVGWFHQKRQAHD